MKKKTFYTVEQKKELVRKVTERQKKGEQIKDIMKDLGMSPFNFFSWRRKLGLRDSISDTSSSPITIHLPPDKDDLVILFGNAEKLTAALASLALIRSAS